MIRNSSPLLTIITYHYIRDLQRSRYPAIKGLTIERFERQLKYVIKNYTVCSVQKIISVMRGQDELPVKPCLLTFDDGLIEHYTNVFPRLEERGIVASFYPPAKVFEEHKILDVHKIHFILASAVDHCEVVKDIFELLNRYRGEYVITDNDHLYKKYAIQGRYDVKEVVFIKRLLQRELPERVRSVIIDNLFMRYVSVDEEVFAKELYMDASQLGCMQRHGMEIGGHGYDHIWFETLSRAEQEEEINRTVNFLGKIYDHRPSNLVMSYPYGSYNALTIELLKKAGFALGLTNRSGLVSDLTRPLELDRLDTNDIPS